MPNIHWFHPLKCEELQLFSVFFYHCNLLAFELLVGHNKLFGDVTLGSEDGYFFTIFDISVTKELIVKSEN